MDDKLEIYTKGTKAWFKDKEEGYVLATMTEKAVTNQKISLSFTLDSNNQAVKYEETIANLEKSSWEDLPHLKNPPHLEGADDLTNLSYLHEAAVLHSVKLRYLNETIYTYSGLVLIAMNPFKRMNIYTPEIMRQYAGRPRTELEPHLFAIAEEAYRRMANDGKNQSIIVSGESGAGKTQSARYVMRYFAVVEELSNPNSGKPKEATEGSSVEEAVLSTNPILEAFGNSKTTRNDNSSRFGKYIEILFNPKPRTLAVEISGARIRTYLLERSRLTFQPESERNYHIFYQLCAAAPAAEKAQLGLDSWDKFFYLKQGKTGTVKGMDDVEEFGITQKGMSTVGISVSAQWDVFKILAALLHIGNIKIIEKGGNSDIADNDAALIKSSELLGVDPTTFKKWLIKKQITTRSEKIMTDASTYQATNSRDSIAKFIYSMLFDWIVKIVNVKLNPAESIAQKSRFIGVLDIYGFEHFQKNSFEQFCINFANEKLQQEFTRHVFRLEQEEYVAEKIAWSFINFSDNQPCIDMIEGKLGILDLLDEESRMPAGKDISLLNKLYSKFGTAEHTFFDKPKFGEVEFVVKHYAIDVTYQIEGFIEKNKDTVSDEQMEMLNASTFEFLKEVVYIEPVEAEKAPARGPQRAANKKPTLGSIFKGSLIKLMDTLRETNPHYIRCIKPNQSKVAFEFEPHNVLGQLIACGVLETIKISRAGYPSKQTYAEFVNRYYFLVPNDQWKTAPKTLTEKICKAHIKGSGKFEMGTTKVFFRAGQLAYLEKIRSNIFTRIVVNMQKRVIRGYHQKRYKKILASAKIIQAAYQDFLKVRDYILNKKAIDEQTEKEVKAELAAQAELQRQQLEAKAVEAALEAQRLKSATPVTPVPTSPVDPPPTNAKDDALRKEIEALRAQMSAPYFEPEAVAAAPVNVVPEINPLAATSEKLYGLLKSKDEQIFKLQEENLEQSDEIRRLRENARRNPVRDDSQTAALKKEVQSLRDQLSRLVAGKYKTDQSSEKFFVKDTIQPKSFETVRNSKAARMSMQFYDTAVSLTSRVSETLGVTETVESKPFKVRPIEIDDDSVPKDRAHRQLGSADLQEEIMNSLIVDLKIPPPGSKGAKDKMEILFPAHLLGYLLSELLENRMIDTVRELFNNVTKAIHHVTMQFKDDYVSSFWFANNFELMSIIKTARKNLPKPSQSNQNDENSPTVILAGVGDDLNTVMGELFNGWLRDIKTRLSPMIVPAIIENQSLTGYVCQINGGIWSQWTSLTSAKPISFDEFIGVLVKLDRTMKSYFVEPSISRQIMIELIRTIGVTAFNHLLTRKNFLTWKRGMQIQNNVSRLEAWCGANGIGEATVHLKQLLQASKLLTLEKNSAGDMDNIFNQCFLLNPTQIKNLLKLYYAADFDSPLSQDLLYGVTHRANNEEHVLLLALDNTPDFVMPEPRDVQVVEKFIPKWVGLPFIQAVLSRAK